MQQVLKAPLVKMCMHPADALCCMMSSMRP